MRKSFNESLINLSAVERLKSRFCSPGIVGLSGSILSVYRRKLGERLDFGTRIPPKSSELLLGKLIRWLLWYKLLWLSKEKNPLLPCNPISIISINASVLRSVKQLGGGRCRNVIGSGAVGRILHNISA